MRLGPIILGRLDERTPIDVTRVDMPLRRLPGAFDGMRIVLMSDLHFGIFASAAFARRALAMATAESPDLLLLAGDMVDRPRQFTRRLAEMLRPIAAATAVAAVLGNHDHYSGPRGFRRIMQAAGVDVLVNEHRLIRRGAEAIALVGLDDDDRGQADVAAAAAGLGEDVCVLLAAHNPDAADMLDGLLRPDAMFAGHTHGGQVRVLGYPLAKEVRNRNYVHGLIAGPGFPIYISRGLGVTGIPIRFGATPELPVVTLRAMIR